jgi:hypothetical protein
MSPCILRAFDNILAAGMAEPVSPADSSRFVPLDFLPEDRQVSLEERAQILRQIERVVEEGRTPVTPEAFYCTPRKTGILFPALINLAAAALVAGGILALSYYFQTRKDNLTLGLGTFQTAEGRLLETYQRQSERRSGRSSRPRSGSGPPRAPSRTGSRPGPKSCVWRWRRR